MTSIKDMQNIYGYTGKRKGDFPFWKGNSQSRLGVLKEVEKASSLSSTTESVAGKSKRDVSNPIHSLHFSWEDPEWTLVYSPEENVVREIRQGESLLLSSCPSLPTLILRRPGQEEVTWTLDPHEKGYSFRCNHYGIFAILRTDGTCQRVEWTTTRPSTLEITHTKMGFLHKEYPFSYRFETNKECDDIFNDFIASHLPVIRPPDSYVVPVKCTSHPISYRQYIGYMKTRTLFQFIIKESGWSFFRRIEEDSDSLVKGVDIQLSNEWTFFPWGKRIEHSLCFR